MIRTRSRAVEPDWKTIGYDMSMQLAFNGEVLVSPKVAGGNFTHIEDCGDDFPLDINLFIQKT